MRVLTRSRIGSNHIDKKFTNCLELDVCLAIFGQKVGYAPHQSAQRDRAYVAGQGPLNPDGSIAEPLGKVGVDLSPEQGYQAAHLSTLTILSSLKRELGDLDRARVWLMVCGLVNAEPDFTLTTNVINGFSDLILEVYGPEAGMHARIAPGLATLPLGVPVTIAAEVAIRS
jgi:hypothetical protein